MSNIEIVKHLFIQITQGSMVCLGDAAVILFGPRAVV